jgi:hypothetical protein
VDSAASISSAAFADPGIESVAWAVAAPRARRLPTVTREACTACRETPRLAGVALCRIKLILRIALLLSLWTSVPDG